MAMVIFARSIAFMVLCLPVVALAQTNVQPTVLYMKDMPNGERFVLERWPGTPVRIEPPGPLGGLCVQDTYTLTGTSSQGIDLVWTGKAVKFPDSGISPRMGSGLSAKDLDVQVGYWSEAPDLLMGVTGWMDVARSGTNVSVVFLSGVGVVLQVQCKATNLVWDKIESRVLGAGGKACRFAENSTGTVVEVLKADGKWVSYK